jgi:hypothetical protein
LRDGKLRPQGTIDKLISIKATALPLSWKNITSRGQDAPELRQTLGGVDIFHRVGVEEGIDRLD